MLYFRMILTMLVSLYTSRVILNTLGIEDYGIYNVVGGVVSMLAFFNIPMSIASQRFLSIEIGKGNFTQLKKVFNALQNIHIVIAIIVLILAETVGLWFVKNYLVIPAERMDAAIWVYHFSVISSMITIFQVPYNAIIIAHERMNVYAYVSILEVTLKLLIVFMLISISFDKLKLYGILYLVVTFIITTIYRAYTISNFKETKFEIVKDKKLYTTLISYSGWNLFGTMTAVIHLQGINILLNLFFGPVVNAARGIATQIQSVINRFVSNFQMAVNPQIIISYASNQRNYMTSLMIRTSKFSFYLLFLVSLPIILETNYILKLWLKTVPEYSSIFTVLVLILILIDSISNPLVTGIQATGNIKNHQFLIGILNLLILPLSYYFLKQGLPPEITLYITIVIYIIILFIRLFISHKLLDFPILYFVKEIIIKNLLIVLLSLFLPLLIRNLINEGVLRLILVSFIALIWSATIIYVIGLQKSEKAIILKSLNKILKRQWHKMK